MTDTCDKRDEHDEPAETTKLTDVLVRDGGGDALSTANAAVCVGGYRRMEVADGGDGGD